MSEVRNGEGDGEAVSRFVERFASAMEDAGIPRMPARVFVSLLATDAARLTARELAELLQVSPAAISHAVRYLTQVNLVSRESEPGSRRHHYRLYDEVWYEALVRRDQVLSRWTTSLEDGVEALGAATPAGRRMAETLDFLDFLQVELAALLERWRTHHAGHDGDAADGHAIERPVDEG